MDRPVAVVARRADHAGLSEFFPGARFFVPCEAKGGLRFSRVLCFFTPAHPSEIEWVEIAMQCTLPPGKHPEWLLTNGEA